MRVSCQFHSAQNSAAILSISIGPGRFQPYHQSAPPSKYPRGIPTNQAPKPQTDRLLANKTICLYPQECTRRPTARCVLLPPRFYLYPTIGRLSLDSIFAEPKRYTTSGLLLRKKGGAKSPYFRILAPLQEYWGPYRCRSRPRRRALALVSRGFRDDSCTPIRVTAI